MGVASGLGSSDNEAVDATRAPFQFSPPGRALFHYRTSSDALLEAHGPPHYAPGGPRRLPAWGFEFSDGLILELQLNESRGLCYVHGPLREVRYAIALLGIDEDRIAWRMDDDWVAFERALEAYHPADWGRWTVTGGGIDPIECLSPGEAQWRHGALAAGGRDGVQVEEMSVEAARERRQRILASGTAQRHLPGESARKNRWEVWQIGPGDTKSLLAMFTEQAKAEAFRTQRSTTPHPAEIRYEVRLRPVKHP